MALSQEEDPSTSPAAGLAIPPPPRTLPSSGDAVADAIAAALEVKAEQSAQRETLKELQRQIDLQRGATAELVARSQSSSVALSKFEEVAQSTASAAEQLEAEIIQVRSCCDSAREAASEDLAAFRAELQEICSKHYSDMGQLCADLSGKTDLPRQDGMDKQELTAMLEARDRALNDQINQVLETAQASISKSFMEVVQGMGVRNPGAASGEQAGINLQLDSMRDAIRELRANMDEGASFVDGAESRLSDDGQSEAGGKLKRGTERHVLDELATMRKDIASCLDAANAAVRLGEHLTNELHIEVEARCSDVKALRGWVGKLLEAPTPAEVQVAVHDEEASALHAHYVAGAPGPASVQFQSQSIQDPIGSQDQIRYAGHSISHSPFIAQRDVSNSMNLTVRTRGEDGMQVPTGSPVDHKPSSLSSMLRGISTLNSQHNLGSQSIPLGTGLESMSGLATPGIMISGGNPLTRRQHTMPAGERYLASQRRASGAVPSTSASNGPVPQVATPSLNASVVSPRQTRRPSPIRNFQYGTVVGQAQDRVLDYQIGRPQAASPVRESPIGRLQSSITAAAGPATALPVFGSAAAPSSTSIQPGSLSLDSSRRPSNGVKLARSASPVQRRTSAV